jgi:small subunit ribosomal protein S6
MGVWSTDDGPYRGRFSQHERRWPGICRSAAAAGKHCELTARPLVLSGKLGCRHIRRGYTVSLYECVLIARNDVTQQQVEGIVDGIASQLETDGGMIMKREYWGLRGLAYRIKKNHKGHYMLIGLDAKPASVNEMERQLRLNEDILRFLTLSVDKIEQEPSAILLRKDDERDRTFRGPKRPARFDGSPRRTFGHREEYRAREVSSEDTTENPVPRSVLPEGV